MFSFKKQSRMSLINMVSRFYRYVNNDLSDPRSANYPLIGNPIQIVSIMTAYLLLTKYGPRMMRHREPFQLDRIVLVYNILQIIFNSYLFIAVVSAVYIPLRYSLLCEPVGTSTTPEGLHVVNLAYIYFLLKLYDLLDTVFIILRKKSSQLSFLHIYHHSGMIFGGWFGAKFVPGGQGVFLGTINCFVHAVMYSYYLLTLIDPKFRASWLKKRITQLQIGQFFLVGLHLMIAAVAPGCNYPKFPIFIILPALGLIIRLFVKFYNTEYTDKREKFK